MTKEEFINDLYDECTIYNNEFQQGFKDCLNYVVAKLSLIDNFDESYWHTEEPKEIGDYLLLIDSDYKYVLATWDGKGFDIDSEYHDEPIISWHRIKSYD